VIVDEAHEHNKNMDLILSRMKYVAYYNNDIKLIIISATMDDDEPVYRRYYREINDNRMFPPNLWLQKHKLDRINIDRRIHISPPGETTRFKITDVYRPEVEKPENIVIDILNKTPDGDILLFQPGQREIKESRDYINSHTSSANVIAIPYYSEMSEDKRKFIDDISTNKKFKVSFKSYCHQMSEFTS
jgi:HrpA-like RNA helicase